MRLGDLANEAALLVRVQSACTTGTALGAVICDCRDQVEKALALIAREGRGLFLYLDEEARGHGLREKVNGMAEMNRGASTVTAALPVSVPPVFGWLAKDYRSWQRVYREAAPRGEAIVIG